MLMAATTHKELRVSMSLRRGSANHQATTYQKHRLGMMSLDVAEKKGVAEASVKS